MIRVRSPLAQGRGLKHGGRSYGGEFDGVAPRTGAWIETPYNALSKVLLNSRPSHRGVD